MEKILLKIEWVVLLQMKKIWSLDFNHFTRCLSLHGIMTIIEAPNKPTILGLGRSNGPYYRIVYRPNFLQFWHFSAPYFSIFCPFNPNKLQWCKKKRRRGKVLIGSVNSVRGLFEINFTIIVPYLGDSINTYIHTYIHTYIQTYIHTYIQHTRARQLVYVCVC